MPAISTQKQIFFTHPKLKAAVDDFVNGVKMSLHRALSQHGDGAARATMPPQADSLEQVFAGYFRLPRAAAGLGAAARAAAPPAPAGVSPADPRPVLDQLVSHRKATNFGLTREEALDLVRDRSLVGYGRDGRLDFGNQEGGGQNPTPPKLIQLRIHKVKCVKETSEWGDDEIALGGLVINDTGNPLKIPEFFVSKSFSTGETRAFNPPRPFASFPAEKNGQKKIVLTILALAEKDHGGFGSFLNELWSRVTLQATIFAGALYWALTSIIPPAAIQAFTLVASLINGLLIGFLVGAALTAVFAILAALFKDEIFDPVSTAFYLTSLDQPVVTPTEVAQYSGHGGKYEVTYDWALVF